MLTARFKHLDLEPGDWVLDLGCGEGRHVHGVCLIDGVHVVGADLNFASLTKALEGVDLVKDTDKNTAVSAFVGADAGRLPFPDGVFKAVICSEVLEHLPDFEAALSEIDRVLRADGRICISVPHAWPERICWRLAPPPEGYAYEPGGHIRIFDETHLTVAVSRLGYQRFKRHFAHGIHMPYWWLKCLFWRHEGEHPLAAAYHRLLVWDILKRPFLTRFLDAILSPVMGKSLVLYFQPRDLK